MADTVVLSKRIDLESRRGATVTLTLNYTRTDPNTGQETAQSLEGAKVRFMAKRLDSDADAAAVVALHSDAGGGIVKESDPPSRATITIPSSATAGLTGTVALEHEVQVHEAGGRTEKPLFGTWLIRASIIQTAP